MDSILRLRLFEWIRHIRYILPHVYLLLFLRCHMFHPYVFGMSCHELSYEYWIPKLTRNAQILTTSHQSIRFTPFSCGRYALRIKVLLFTTRYAHKSGKELAQKK